MTTARLVPKRENGLYLRAVCLGGQPILFNSSLNNVFLCVNESYTRTLHYQNLEIMKRTHIILIVAIAVAIGCLSVAAGDMSTYANFADATAQHNTVKVVGTLVKDRPVDYDPKRDANAFMFWMKDKKGNIRQVQLLAAKPQEFERSEEIVLSGQMKGETFVASDMLMKCPSKYKDEEVYVKGQEKS
jgi:cytochrome c-type biogenesis protein CcmE